MPPVGYIFDLKKYAIHDGPGIRTTVFFQGCPLNCRWCHNPESRGDISPNKELPQSLSCSMNNETEKCHSVTVDEVMNDILKDEIFYDQSGGGVTFSGGEPMMQTEFLFELLKRCKKENIHTTLDTSGFVPLEKFDEIYKLVDLFLYDLKIMDDSEHEKYIGVSNQMIHENLKKLVSRDCNINIRIPMIPTISDTKENLMAMVDFIAPFESVKKISLLPYNQFGADKIRRLNLDLETQEWETQPREELLIKAGWLESLGYEVKIGG